MAFKRKIMESTEPELAIELDAKKQITVRKFNGVKLVDIREFYVDKASGQKLPGKKGISLTEDLWKKLLSVQDEVQRGLADLGELSKKKVRVETEIEGEVKKESGDKVEEVSSEE